MENSRRGGSVQVILPEGGSADLAVVHHEGDVFNMGCEGWLLARRPSVHNMTATSVTSLLFALCLFLLAGTATAEQQRQLLARAESSLGVADWLDGGSCGDAVEGCRREAISARATVLGQPFDADDCGVVERSGGDGYTMDDVTDGFTFGVLHTCESEGEVVAQVGGFSVFFSRKQVIFCLCERRRFSGRGPLSKS